MATFCKKKCIELKELFESKLDEQQLQSDSALQALRIDLVSADRSGEAVDGERRKAIKAAEAAIEERDKVVLETRALRLGLHVGVPTYKVFTPEEQDSGESNKFGSAGSNAIGSIKHGQEFAAATSVGTFVPTDPSVTYQHVGRNAAATSVGPSNCKTVGESPFSFSKSYVRHTNADTMDDFFSKLVVKGGSSTMLHPTATAQSFGPSIVNKGASTGYMTVTEPNPLFSGPPPGNRTRTEAATSGGNASFSTGFNPPPGSGNPSPVAPYSYDNGNGGNGGGGPGDQGGSGGPGGPPSDPNPFNMPSGSGRKPDKNDPARKTKSGGGNGGGGPPDSSSSSSSDDSKKKKKKEKKKKHILSDSDSDDVRPKKPTLFDCRA